MRFAIVMFLLWGLVFPTTLLAQDDENLVVIEDDEPPSSPAETMTEEEEPTQLENDPAPIYENEPKPPAEEGQGSVSFRKQLFVSLGASYTHLPSDGANYLALDAVGHWHLEEYFGLGVEFVAGLGLAQSKPFNSKAYYYGIAVSGHVYAYSSEAVALALGPVAGFGRIRRSGVLRKSRLSDRDMGATFDQSDATEEEENYYKVGAQLRISFPGMRSGGLATLELGYLYSPSEYALLPDRDALHFSGVYFKIGLSWAFVSSS